MPPLREGAQCWLAARLACGGHFFAINLLGARRAGCAGWRRKLCDIGSLRYPRCLIISSWTRRAHRHGTATARRARPVMADLVGNRNLDEGGRCCLIGIAMSDGGHEALASHEEAWIRHVRPCGVTASNCGALTRLSVCLSARPPLRAPGRLAVLERRPPRAAVRAEPRAIGTARARAAGGPRLSTVRGTPIDCSRLFGEKMGS